MEEVPFFCTYAFYAAHPRRIQLPAIAANRHPALAGMATYGLELPDFYCLGAPADSRGKKPLSIWLFLFFMGSFFGMECRRYVVDME
jgi:hypothetical protein